MPQTDATHTPLRQYKSHPRDWRQNLYVYPVLSRRSAGLSIGVNLNPDAACNFDCVYCQVDRTKPPRVREVDIEVLRAELSGMLAQAQSGALFREPEFADLPRSLQHVNDIALSGDGEPTTCKHFFEAVSLIAELKRQAGLGQVKIVLITDACYLTKPEVAKALIVMDENNGEIWAKLDAGTEAYFQAVNRPNFTLAHVLENIKSAARVRPVVIQALFLRLNGKSPDDTEIEAFTDRLNEITYASGAIRLVQVYTIARPPVESYVSPLSNPEVDRIVEQVQGRTGLAAKAFYGAE